jgi:hypothetical protein
MSILEEKPIMTLLLRLMLSFILFGMIKSVYAVCPLCTIAAGIGVGSSQYFGIDDTITGIWIGGIIISSALWFAHYLRSLNVKILFTRSLSIILFYSVTIIPMCWMNLFGIEGNTLWNVDKLMLGIIVGTLVFVIGSFTDIALRATNNCEVYFYFQKIILPISLLLVASGVFYYFTC